MRPVNVKGWREGCQVPRIIINKQPRINRAILVSLEHSVEIASISPAVILVKEHGRNSCAFPRAAFNGLRNDGLT